MAWLLAGCYSPDLEHRSLLCGGPSGECPSPLVCGCDGVCHTEVIDRIVEIVGGSDFTCARRESGTVACAGRNDQGELGDGTGIDRSDPAPVSGLASVTALATGFSHACALQRDGTIWCWGLNDAGQIGDGSTEDRLSPVEIALPARAIDIATGDRHSCALLEAGGLWCWGRNDHGQLGNANGDSIVPTSGPVIDNVVGIDAGGDHTCARTQTNDLWCWGRNSDGELGNGGTDSSPVPTRPIGLEGQVAAASLGRFHTCALTSDNRAFCWGDNDFGQLGNGMASLDRKFPQHILATETGKITRIAVGEGHSCVLRTDGTVACFGSNAFGQLGDGTAEDRLNPVPVVGIADAIGFGIGRTVGCAWGAEGTASCWGKNIRGELGNGETTVRNRPLVVPNLGAVQRISVGYFHTCADTASGLSCWGRNEYGQLGDGTREERHAPTVPSFVGAASFDSVNHTCAVREAGTVWCWGSNTGGQLGDNSTTDRSVPTQVVRAAGVPLAGAQQVVTGSRHSCAIVDEAGTTSVYCWGRNDYGELGTDPATTQERSLLATQVPGISNVTQLTAGIAFTCALRPEANDATTVLCWGFNANGQLGDGTTGLIHPTPVAAQSLTTAIQISAGHQHVCAVTKSHEVYCWGRNLVGELGQDPKSLSYSALPIQIAGLEAIEVRGGLAVNCARRPDDQVICWGTNYSGELGDGTFHVRSTPAPVANDLHAVELSAKYSHVCARSGDGTVSCWGLNTNGQLGDGTTTGAVVPVVSQLSCPGGTSAP